MGLLVKRAVSGFLLLIGAAWSYGAAAFLAADGSLTWTLPQRAPLPTQADNLASFRFGPTLRASSYHRGEASHHHPAFLIDGRTAPTLLEKWSSGLLDREPWIEIEWREPRDLSMVQIWHAGVLEPPAFTIRSYRISCLGARAPAPSVWVTSNRSPIATHALGCRGARGVRIDWTPNAPGDVVRVFEVEVWSK